MIERGENETGFLYDLLPELFVNKDLGVKDYL